MDDNPRGPRDGGLVGLTENSAGYYYNRSQSTNLQGGFRSSLASVPEPFLGIGRFSDPMDYTLSNNIYAPDHTFPAPTPHDLSHLGGPYGETQPLPYSPGAWDSTLLPSNLQHSSDSLTEIQQMAPVPLSRIDVCNPINIAGETSEETYTSSSLRPHKRKRTAQGISTMSELGVQMNHCHFSDSAYGRSVDTRSVPGDYSGGYHFNAMEPTDTADTPSVYSDFDTYLPLVNLQPEPTPATPPVSQISDHSNSRSLPRQRLTSKRPQWKCDVPNCDKSLRTKSEYNKHMARHERRYKCDAPKCRLKRGFATRNDLDRHKKSVHHIRPTHGTADVFRCFAPGCTKPDKLWERLDNFRFHLSRVHKDCDADKMVSLSNEWLQSNRDEILASLFRDDKPPSVADSETVVSQSIFNGTDVFIERPNLVVTDTSLSLTTNEQTDSSLPRPSQDIILGSVAAHIQARESLEEEGAETGVPQALRRGFLISNSQSDDPRLSENRGLGSQFLSNAQANQDHSSSSDGLGEPAMDFFKDLDEINTTRLGGNHALPNRPSDENMEKSQGSSYLSLLPTCNENQRDYDMQLLRTSYTPLPANDHTTNNADSAPASSANVPDNKATPRKVETGPVECPECGVQFRRRSDLNKHLKRHSRPYGCTFTDCNKEFGSKSDWKRHENSTHFNLETWRCTEPEIKAGAEIGISLESEESLCPQECAREFSRSEKFASHLREDHYLPDHVVRNRLQTRKIGRNGQGQFWCGFCQALVRVGSEGLDAWQERFDHIDFQHFARGQRIDDWLPPKGMLTKGERQKALEEGLLLLDPETVDNITSDVNNDTRRLYNSLDNNGSTNRNQALEPVKEARLVSRHASPLAPTDYFEAGSTVSPNPARRARMSRGNASQAATRSANTLSPQGIFRPSAPNAAQRQAIADDLISFTVPERKPDPHEDVDQCVIECCVCENPYTLALETYCTMCAHPPCARCIGRKVSDS